MSFDTPEDATLADVFYAQSQLLNGPNAEKGIAVLLTLLDYPKTYHRASYELGRFCSGHNEHVLAIHYLSNGALPYDRASNAESPRMIADLRCATALAEILLDQYSTPRTDAGKARKLIATDILSIVTNKYKQSENLSELDAISQLTKHFKIKLSDDVSETETWTDIHNFTHHTQHLRTQGAATVKAMASIQRQVELQRHVNRALFTLGLKENPAQIEPIIALKHIQGGYPYRSVYDL